MTRRRWLVVVTVLAAACSGPTAGSAGPTDQSGGTASLAASPSSTLPSTSAIASASPSPSASVVSDLPDIIAIEDLPGVTAITDIGVPDWVAIAGGSAWAAGVNGGIGRFDLATGTYSKSTPTGGVCLAMDVAFDSLWVGDCDASRLLRIDPKTGRVTNSVDIGLPLAAESSVAAGEGAVWVIADGRLVHVNPKTNKVSHPIDAPAAPAAIRAGAGGLWLISDEAKVLRLDPTTGKVVAEIPVGPGPRFTAIGAGSVWVLNQGDGSVSRIDAKANRVVATIRVSIQSVEGGDMAFGGGYAWARVSDCLVAQIDPATNAVIRRLGNPQGSGSVAADADAVWISAHDVHTLWRVALD